MQKDLEKKHLTCTHLPQALLQTKDKDQTLDVEIQGKDQKFQLFQRHQGQFQNLILERLSVSHD